MDWLETVSGKLVALAAGIAAMLWLVQKAWRLFRKIDRIFRIVEFIEAEMKPNGGNSLRDKVNGVDAKLDAHLAEHAKAPVTVNVGTAGLPGQPSQTTAGS